jgi:hypothetical protein
MKTDDYYVIMPNSPDEEVLSYWTGRGLQFLEGIDKAVRFKDEDGAQRVASHLSKSVDVIVRSVRTVLDFGDSKRPTTDAKEVSPEWLETPEEVSEPTWVLVLVDEDIGHPMYWVYGDEFHSDVLRATKFPHELLANEMRRQLAHTFKNVTRAAMLPVLPEAA